MSEKNERDYERENAPSEPPNKSSPSAPPDPPGEDDEDEPISLYPLEFEEAVRRIMKVPWPPPSDDKPDR